MFGVWILIYVAVTFGRAVVIFYIYIKSTTNMHNKMVERVVRAKILFFDSNPIGRILTRFSKDMAVLDLLMPTISVFLTFGLFRTITVAIAVCYIHWPMICVIVPIFLGMVLFVRNCVNTLSQTQSLDSIYRGPIHSTFTNIVNGLVSLRTYERVDYFKHEFVDQLEKSCNVTFTFYALNRWVSFGLDTYCILFTLGVAIFTITAKGKTVEKLDADGNTVTLPAFSNDVLAFTL